MVCVSYAKGDLKGNTEAPFPTICGIKPLLRYFWLISK